MLYQPPPLIASYLVKRRAAELHLEMSEVKTNVSNVYEVLRYFLVSVSLADDGTISLVWP